MLVAVEIFRQLCQWDVPIQADQRPGPGGDGFGSLVAPGDPYRQPFPQERWRRRPYEGDIQHVYGLVAEDHFQVQPHIGPVRIGEDDAFPGISPLPQHPPDEVHLQRRRQSGPQTVLSEGDSTVGSICQHRQVSFGAGTGQVVDDAAVGGRRRPGGSGLGDRAGGVGDEPDGQRDYVVGRVLVPRVYAFVRVQVDHQGLPPPGVPRVPCPCQAGTRHPVKGRIPDGPFRQDFPLRPSQTVDADGQVLGLDGAQMARGDIKGNPVAPVEEPPSPWARSGQWVEDDVLRDDGEVSRGWGRRSRWRWPAGQSCRYAGQQEKRTDCYPCEFAQLPTCRLADNGLASPLPQRLRRPPQAAGVG